MDLDANDLPLITESVKDAEALEDVSAQIGLHFTEGKTEHITSSTDTPGLKSLSGATIKRLDDIKYLEHSSWTLKKTFAHARKWHGLLVTNSIRYGGPTLKTT